MGKLYQHWSTNALEDKLVKNKQDIAEWEHDIKTIKSKIYVIVLSKYIRKAREENRAIEAELFYRKNHQ